MPHIHSTPLSVARIGWSVLISAVLLSGCGGSGSSTSATTADTTAPVISGVNVSTSAVGYLRVSAAASDNVGVTGYCFKTSSSTPLASDACFQTSATASIALPQTSAVSVWAKDASGNVSASASAGCSATGLSASQASTLPTVCVSTSLGQFVLELESTKAPITSANFLKYVNDNYYSQTVFHRVISNFMVQGGGYTGVPINAGNVKSGTIYAPITLETPAATGLRNVTGSIAMARTSAPDSATTQFFINVVDNSGSPEYLDTNGGGYAVFGRVISGMDTTIQAIRNVSVQSNGSEVSQPLVPPTIAWAYALK